MDVRRGRWFYAVFALGALAFCGAPARAEVRKLGANYYIAGVPRDHFEFFAAPGGAGRQQMSNWCWAACIQMVLNYHGLAVTQDAVVKRVFGGLVDRPAQPAQILAALSGWAPDRQGRPTPIRAIPGVLKSSQIVRDLSGRWPMIVGLANKNGKGGHALVLTAAYYGVGAGNEPAFEKVVLRDPWPDNPSIQEISWGEFRRRLVFIAHVYVERKR